VALCISALELFKVSALCASQQDLKSGSPKAAAAAVDGARRSVGAVITAMRWVAERAPLVVTATQAVPEGRTNPTSSPSPLERHPRALSRRAILSSVGAGAALGPAVGPQSLGMGSEAVESRVRLFRNGA
jgi:hypothetical protein